MIFFKKLDLQLKKSTFEKIKPPILTKLEINGSLAYIFLAQTLSELFKLINLVLTL
jgi:hypothetical protein